MGLKCACKSVSKRKLVRRADVDDMRREIIVLQHLSGHPNVVQFKGAFKDSEHVDLVMEFCSGGGLFDRFTAKGSYSERQAAAVFRDIVGIVHVCHFMGVMHRDLKPEDLLLARRGRRAPPGRRALRSARRRRRALRRPPRPGPPACAPCAPRPGPPACAPHAPCVDARVLGVRPCVRPVRGRGGPPPVSPRCASSAPCAAATLQHRPAAAGVAAAARGPTGAGALRRLLRGP